jgi:2-polyprenyl-3-methyl-5-hydroxy-6-metoxy-1,4-benzoquinol methylase
MNTQIAPPGYESKPSDYFKYVRPEMLPFVPAHCRRLLDVGCGEGAFGESLRRARGIEVWGVEPFKSAAETARTKLDRVIEGVFGSDIALPVGIFDCVLFNDVLEHMIAPERALDYARDLLAPGGVVVASIPNIRSFPTIWQLIVHASWEYTDSGVLDKTHLRFFTRSSMIKMFEKQGYAVEGAYGINAYYHGNPRIWAAYRLANALFAGKLSDMKFLQFAVVAKPTASLQNGEAIPVIAEELPADGGYRL